MIPLGVHAVGETVAFQVPAGTGGVTLLSQGAEPAAAPFVIYQGVRIENTVVPLTVTAGATLYFDDRVVPPDDPAEETQRPDCGRDAAPDRGVGLLGGDASTNAEITKAVLTGDDGARRKVVVLNAALAIVAGGKAKTIPEGIKVAEECIDSGAAIKKLQALIEMSRS